MKRKIQLDTIKALLAKTGNKCAFEGCDHPIFDQNNLYVANLCHIEGVSINGPRHNSNYSNIQINSFDNLMFLCYRHHKEIDSNPQKYTTKKLKQIKSNHEAKFEETQLRIDKNQIDQILFEKEIYWSYFQKDYKSEHEIPELRFDIEANAKFEELYIAIHESLDSLESILGIIDFNKPEYFDLCIGLPNHMMQIHLLIDQMRIKNIELELALNPLDIELKNKLAEVRKDFKELSKIACRID